jgi:hypothetical protein
LCWLFLGLLVDSEDGSNMFLHNVGLRYNSQDSNLHTRRRGNLSKKWNCLYASLISTSWSLTGKLREIAEHLVLNFGPRWPYLACWPRRWRFWPVFGRCRVRFSNETPALLTGICYWLFWDLSGKSRDISIKYATITFFHWRSNRHYAVWAIGSSFK